MIKAVIFDLDGVLLDSRELHYEALNNALARHNHNITREEHLSTYDGLSTKKKLAMLTEKKGLSSDLYEDIWKAKQEETIKIIKQMTPDYRIIDVLSLLEKDGYKIVVCSNSIRETTKLMLLKKGFLEHIEFFLSNQDVIVPKPSPEMYLRTMIQLQVSPEECLIVEDSHIGRKSAIASGAHLFPVENSSGVIYGKIKEAIDKINGLEKGHEHGKIKWQDKRLNIVIPMAGDDISFEKAGYTYPKPLIEINGKPMIQLVVENLNTEGNFIFIVKKEHYEKYHLNYLLNLIAPGCKIIPLDKPTEGAVQTVLLARNHINNEDPLVIANGDQFIEWNSNEFFYSMAADECDGGILTFESTHPKWSYAKPGPDGYVVETAEKIPISKNATAGVYHYKKGSEFVKYAEQMMRKNIRYNNLFYVCPVYNEFIQDGKKIRLFNINRVWKLGTPEDLETFKKNEISKTV
ncbi:MAG: HAD-IA family hydrolase [Candidatus Nanoarchaeia archaeon]